MGLFIEELEQQVVKGQGRLSFEDMKRKTVVNGQDVWVPTGVIIVKFEGNTLPKKLLLDG